MFIIHPPHIMAIFVRNKTKEGLTRPQIAALIRRRLRWDTLDPADMTPLGQERYRQTAELLKELEAHNDEGPP